MKSVGKMIVAGLLFAASAGHAEVRTEKVAYKHGKTALEGVIAWDDAKPDRRPGVIVVHEWWGLGDYSVNRAKQLAERGYVAFAIDMYGKGVRAKTHDEAGKLSGALRENRDLMRARAAAALDRFKNDARVNPEKIAAIGYCFGGTTVLEMARAGMPLAGVASFHGGLATSKPAGPGDIKARVIVFHGAEDSFVAKEVPGFQDEMDKAGADWQMVVYGDAVHSFTVPAAGDDPSKGMAYNAKADIRSWEALADFLGDVFN
jgi:dienelactone hydrolase